MAKKVVFRDRLFAKFQGMLVELLVDEQDLERVAMHKWFALSKRGRAFSIQANGEKHLILSRLILDAPKGLQVDHINGNIFDNRRSNLRIVSNQQNQWNSRKRKRTSSKYKGVCLNKAAGKWVSAIYKDRKYFYLGFFVSEDEAALAYNKAAKEMFGEYASLNEVTDEKAQVSR